MECLDWKLVSFITVALLQDHYLTLHRPKVYFWSIQERYEKK